MDVAEGMTWRRFRVLLAGLSPGAIWRLWLKDRATRPLEGQAAEAYFESMIMRR